MRFVTLGEDTVRIILDGKDMEMLGVRYENMDYSDTRTKKMIWGLLDEAKKSTGFDADGERLHIQVYPSGEDGCEMYISKLARGEKREKRVFYFPDFESLLSAFSFLRNKSSATRSAELYSYKKGYCLCLFHRGYFPEFGREIADSLGYCHVKEHGKIIAEGEGIERLGSIFLK